MENEGQYFKRKFETRNSIREVAVASEISSEGYDIAPYSIRHEPALNLSRIAAGGFLCLIGAASLVAGINKKIKNDNFQGDEYWLASISFIILGTAVIYHALKSKYASLENYS